MAQRIITVNIGPDLTLAAETEYRTAKPKVYKSFYLPTPEELLTDGVITSDEVILEKFADDFKEHMRQNKMNNKKVLFVADSKRMAGREESLPKLSDSKLRGLVQTNASDYFPVAMDAYQVTCKIIEEPQKEDNTVRTQRYAIPQNVITSYEHLAEVLDMSLVTIDCRANAIIQFTKSVAESRTMATLYMSTNEVVFTVVSNGIMQMQRSINYGIGELYDMVSDNNKEALIKLHDESIFSNEESMDAIDDALMMMTGSIKRMLEFYKSKFFESELEDIYLIGLGDGIKGMAYYLTERIGVEIKHSISFTEDTTSDIAHLSNTIAAGGAIDPIELEIGGKSARRWSFSDSLAEDNNYIGTFVVLIILVVLAIAVTVVPYVMYQLSVREGLRLDNTIASLKPSKTVYLEYLEANVEYEDLSELKELTDTPANRLLEFLQELEAKLPRSATILSIAAGTESVAVEFVVPDKATAAQVFIQMRGFDTVMDAKTSSVDETASDEGITEVRFIVNCVYKPVDNQE